MPWGASHRGKTIVHEQVRSVDEARLVAGATAWEHLAPAEALAEPAPKPTGHDVEQAFETFAPSRLTRREQGIVSLILRGHSSMSIGRILEIAEGTVKIHRKHIYAKLDISSQTELFNPFIKHLLVDRGPS
ncbi:helix-turn-helix transcriptional regulator [Mesorhizobium sp. INR15]|uniref:helix-turn-helix transcriptional regulator n=1 Tax=Mesorhizobium sp. INR15 TaxID=2654248 RepID=UPI001AEEAA7C|nr:helix-turn-helix transcriptional regulator [Mesorhizobium sp. INR15]